MTLGRKIISENKEWNTPPKYVDIISKFFDKNIELDPCSNKYSLIESKIKYTLPINGLKESWNYKTIFVNPPYGRDSKNKTSIKNWIIKGFEANNKYDSEVLFLIPVATNTKHFKNYIFPYGKGICFLEDTRLKFWIDGKEYEKGAPMACCFVYFGNNYNKFHYSFSECGKCLQLNI